MGKKKGPAWDFFKEKDKGVVCKYCSKEYKQSNVNKMTKHIKKCFKCPQDLKKYLDSQTSNIQGKEKEGMKKSGEGLKELSVDVSFVPPCPSPSPGSFGSRRPGSAMSSKSDIDMSISVASSTSQESEVSFLQPRASTMGGGGSLLSFVDTMDPQLNESLNQSLAKAIFVSGAPLSMMEHPLWLDFFRKMRPSYIPPSRYRIASTYLDSQYAEMQNDITTQLKNSKTLHLQCDGWSNIRNESIINIVISKPEPLFVEFIPTKENRHNAQYLAELVIKTIEKYGPDKFLVLIGDNARNMQSALSIVKERFPHIIQLGCLAHLLHLLCGNILGCATVKTFMATAIDVVKTVKNSHLLKAIFDRLQSEKKFKDRISLKLPGTTRWGSHLFCLESLQANKSVLQKLAVSEEADISADLKRRILDDAVFWVRVEKMINMLSPIIDLITSFEGNNEMIHKVYVKLNELQETLTSEIPLSPLQQAEENKILQNLTKRMKRGISKIHLAGDLLNPSSIGCHLKPEELLDAIGFICETGQSMGLAINDIKKDLADYRDKEGLWNRTFIWDGVAEKSENEEQVSPLLWWRQLRGTCVLADIAIKILGAPITSAATERTFSTFSWIHNKKRNRLTTARASKITYISHNWHLLNQQKKTKPKKTKQKPSTARAGTSHQEVEDEEEVDRPRSLDELSSESLTESEDEALDVSEESD